MERVDAMMTVDEVLAAIVAIKVDAPDSGGWAFVTATDDTCEDVDVIDVGECLGQPIVRAWREDA